MFHDARVRRRFRGVRRPIRALRRPFWHVKTAWDSPRLTRTRGTKRTTSGHPRTNLQFSGRIGQPGQIAHPGTRDKGQPAICFSDPEFYVEERLTTGRKSAINMFIFLSLLLHRTLVCFYPHRNFNDLAPHSVSN